MVPLAPLPAEILSWARLTPGPEGEGTVSLDVTLTDPEGRVIVEVEGFYYLARAAMVKDERLPIPSSVATRHSPL